VQRPLRLALIGMSGAGKTYWTQKLAAQGWPAVCCDEQIEQRLAPRLRAGGYTGINGVAAWMGWPDSPAYPEREAQYLAEENQVLGELLADLEHDPAKSLILDTTGSVIYTGNHLLYRLRKLMTVVYLVASESERQLLLDRYLSDPKPVLWRGVFQPKAGESPRETVARCYPVLAEGRRRSYEALAHCTLSVSELRDSTLTAEGFLGRAFQELERSR
jgi:hypothetical protein